MSHEEMSTARFEKGTSRGSTGSKAAQLVPKRKRAPTGSDCAPNWQTCIEADSDEGDVEELVELKEEVRIKVAQTTRRRSGWVSRDQGGYCCQCDGLRVFGREKEDCKRCRHRLCEGCMAWEGDFNDDETNEYETKDTPDSLLLGYARNVGRRMKECDMEELVTNIRSCFTVDNKPIDVRAGLCGLDCLQRLARLRNRAMRQSRAQHHWYEEEETSLQYTTWRTVEGLQYHILQDNRADGALADTLFPEPSIPRHFELCQPAQDDAFHALQFGQQQVPRAPKVQKSVLSWIELIELVESIIGQTCRVIDAANCSERLGLMCHPTPPVTESASLAVDEKRTGGKRLKQKGSRASLRSLFLGKR